MKYQFRIGEFARQVGLTPKALRIYEQKGLLKSGTRSENGYRLYGPEQLERIQRLLEFKRMGFRLSQIKTLLDSSLANESPQLRALLERRLQGLRQEQGLLEEQKRKIESILTSLKQGPQPLKEPERRFIMSLFKQVSIVVTGHKDLVKTAHLIREHLAFSSPEIPVLVWDGQRSLEIARPHVVVIAEDLLGSAAVRELKPDVVVVRDLSHFDDRLAENYLQLFSSAGPHMATIFNADDRASIELAKSPVIQKGKIYYFSKNAGVEDQLKNIGGILSDGEEVKIFGFNRTREDVTFKLDKIFSHDDEVTLIASLAAVMDIGLARERLPASVS